VPIRSAHKKGGRNRLIRADTLIHARCGQLAGFEVTPEAAETIRNFPECSGLFQLSNKASGVKRPA
jgi:hypothetical protein